MRATESNGLMIRKSLMGSTRALRLSAVALGIGLLLASGAARAQQKGADDDEQTFEEKIIEGIMKGIGGTNMENTGIDYRERSPLVVPPKLDLPPPASAAQAKAPPNWPKDPDEARRKAAIAARKKESKDPAVTNRILTPSELNVGRVATRTRESNDPVQPGVSNNNPILSPSQLGFNGSLSDLFGGNKSETKEFKSEPTRDSLTQPPAGYQTPSPNYAYGTGPKEILNKEYNPVAGKYGD
jgi:type IV secretory pathway VirB10-like protein